MARTDTPTTEPTGLLARATAGRPWLVPAAIVAAIGLAVVLWLTQPWLLFVDVVAEETLPISIEDATGSGASSDGGDTEAASAAADDDQAADRSGGADDDPVEDQMGTTEGEPDGAVQTDAVEEPAATESEAEAAAEPTGPVVLATGSFISRDHGTSGTAAIVQLEDGSRVLTIEDLDTDNGPDLFVYLDDTPADGPEAEFDDGISLGALRANQGDLVYDIPADVDLDDVISVGIWCDRFSSLFGAADLVPVG